MTNKQYICIRAWTRNSVGDVLTEWEYTKLPYEVKNETYFKQVEPVVTSTKDLAIVLANELPVEPTIEPNNIVQNYEQREDSGQPTNTQKENDIRPAKRPRFLQDTLGTTNSSGQESVPTVHD